MKLEAERSGDSAKAKAIASRGVTWKPSTVAGGGGVWRASLERRQTKVKAIATTLAMLAGLVGASAFAQTTPKALGWERGQAVPEGALIGVRPAIHDLEGSPYKVGEVTALLRPKALRQVRVWYTEKSGVCEVEGYAHLNPNDPPELQQVELDKWAERIASKFGGIAGRPAQWGNGPLYGYYWGYTSAEGTSQVPDGYQSVAVTPFMNIANGEISAVKLNFDFKEGWDGEGWTACRGEVDAYLEKEKEERATVNAAEEAAIRAEL